VRLVGEQLAKKDRMNFVVRNCAERMMKIIKNLGDECKQENNSNIESLNAFKKIELSKGNSKDDLDAETAADSKSQLDMMPDLALERRTTML
jgi:hypothetical protein